MINFTRKEQRCPKCGGHEGKRIYVPEFRKKGEHFRIFCADCGYKICEMACMDRELTKNNEGIDAPNDGIPRLLEKEIDLLDKIYRALDG